MAKKLLIFVFFIGTVVFSQNNEESSVALKVQNPNGKTISEVAAYPNPFNIKSVISFNSTTEQIVIFEVKNVLGRTVYQQKIKTVNGKNEINFQKDNLTAGMYIYSIQTDTEIVSKRLVIK